MATSYAGELSYCQRLTQRLDRQDTVIQNGQAEKNEQATHLKVIKLPAELRQLILFNTVSDDDLMNSKLKRRQAARISKTCRTFEADIKCVRKRWRKRELELIEWKRTHKGEFDGYIAELMAPILIAKTSLTARQAIPISRRRRERKHTETTARRADQERQATMRGHEWKPIKRKQTKAIPWCSQKWSMQSEAEREAAGRWRKQSQLNIEQMKNGGRRDRITQKLMETAVLKIEGGFR